jgi:hypothetical protein
MPPYQKQCDACDAQDVCLIHVMGVTHVMRDANITCDALIPRDVSDEVHTCCTSNGRVMHVTYVLDVTLP